MEVLDYGPPLKKSERPFGVSNVLTLGAGPCTVSPRVLHALSAQTIQPLNIIHDKIMNEIRDMAKYVFQTKNEITFALQASGNGGVETMVSNLTEPGDTVIVGISGFWGQRMADICGRYELNVVRLLKPNNVFTLKEMEEAIKQHKPTAVFLTHAETITGVLQPLEGWADLCHRYNCLLGIDAVVALAAAPLFTDRWKLDAVVGGSQKAIGCVAGMALVTFSPLAKERIWAKKHPPPFYFDVKGLADAWNCFGTIKTYHITYSSNLLAALHEALAEICEEGLENRLKRHKDCSELLWPKLEELGAQLCVEKPENRFVAVTAFKPPADINRLVLSGYFLDKYELDISLGGEPNSLRVGFLGFNAQIHAVEYFLNAFEESIDYIRKNKLQDEEAALKKFAHMDVIRGGVPKK